MPVTASYIYSQLAAGDTVKLGVTGHAEDVIGAGMVLGVPWLILDSDRAQTDVDPTDNNLGANPAIFVWDVNNTLYGEAWHRGDKRHFYASRSGTLLDRDACLRIRRRRSAARHAAPLRGVVCRKGALLLAGGTPASASETLALPGNYRQHRAGGSQPASSWPIICYSRIRSPWNPHLDNPNPMPERLISSILQTHKDFSDLFFVVGKPLQIEAHGELLSFPDDLESSILQPLQVEEFAMSLMNGMARLKQDLQESGACDCSYSSVSGRFRVNIFRQNGNHAIVMRKLNTAIPTMDGLKLQPIFRDIIKEKTGIIFVTGATGSGKSTTLAAMLNELNQTSKMHIVTLEDPIEFLHPHKKATFSQRELGRDFPSFAAGLRSALRQAPKAILVGEIRDRETMEISLTAAETGHVVYSTLHTINAGQTINRILGFFTNDEQQLVRERLADTLRYIVSQRLIPKVGGGRLMINEIMGSNLRTRETLLLGEGENRTYSEIIDASATYGWRTFDRTLIESFSQNLITEETAMMFASSRNKVRTGIDRAKKLSGREEPGGPSMKLAMTGNETAASPGGPSVDLIAMPAAG